MEALHITDTAGCPIHSLRVDIGRITVEQAAYAVPPLDKLQGVLVLQRHTLQAFGQCMSRTTVVVYGINNKTQRQER